jgi:translation initiation factor IF-2
VTFLDTPGHAAFSSMRARGARITDIVVLVVAADDGIQQQTLESIKHAQRSQVPIVVAVNKCDKPGADASKVHTALLHHGVQLERFGGDVQCVEISALKGTNIPALIEAILIQADLMSLRGNPCCHVEGVVIEAHKDKGLGAVATILIQNGTLKKGKYLVAGETWAKVKAMLNEKKIRRNEASLSQPVVTVGWKDIPEVGEEVLEVETEQKAKEVISHRMLRSRREQRKGQLTVNTDREQSVVPLIIKADVAGSAETLRDVIVKNQPKEIQLKVVSVGLGPISDSDVETASGIDAKILGFNVDLPKMCKPLAQRLKVEVMTNRVIYRLLDQLRDSLEEMLPSEEEEEMVGEAVVLDTFRLTGARRAAVAGCRVKKGVLERNCSFRIVRDGKSVFSGRVESMKNKRDDITTAKRETECGLSFHGNKDFEKGDIVQCYRVKKIPRKLTWEFGF